MTTFVIDDDLTILNIYQCPESCIFTEDQHTHIVLPITENPILYSPSRDVNGAIILVKDPFKIEKYEKSKFDPIRRERNRLLQESDWTQFPNNPLTPEKRAEWETYRQALRDLPANTTDPTNVTWPTPPIVS